MDRTGPQAAPPPRGPDSPHSGGNPRRGPVGDPRPPGRKDDGAMSLFKTFLASGSSRGGPAAAPAKAEAARRRGVAIERLDHRQLLAVNFTGNVHNRFPRYNRPRRRGPPRQPEPSSTPRSCPTPTLQNLIQVSGFDINGIRVSYTAADDTLSIGLQTADNPKHPGHRGHRRRRRQQRQLGHRRPGRPGRPAGLPGLPGPRRLGVHGGLPGPHRGRDPPGRRGHRHRRRRSISGRPGGGQCR